jgi:hypothetical protein
MEFINEAEPIVVPTGCLGLDEAAIEVLDL